MTRLTTDPSPLLCALAVVSLTACGGGSETGTDTDSATTTLGTTSESGSGETLETSTTDEPTTEGPTGTASESESDPSDSSTDPSDTEEPTTDSDTSGGCTASDECPEGEVCVDQVCTPFNGPCDTNEDCEGDTYCCADNCLPPGESPGACLPYPDDGNDPTCDGEIQIGLFEASVQCEWTEPPEGDLYPGHVNVLATPMVADLPHSDGGEFGSTEVVIVSYNFTDGGSNAAQGADPAYYGVIRILSGNNCTQLETIHDPENPIIASSPPAIADLDNDGIPEIITHRRISGVVAFKWDPQAQQYTTYWVATDTGVSGQNRWDGPSVHDLDNDGFPEVLSGSAVFVGTTGQRLNVGQIIGGASPSISPGVIQIAGDVDNDGKIELLAGAVYEWDIPGTQWVMEHTGSPAARHYAFADFGTPGMNPEDFDATALDGIAEIVTTGDSLVRLWTLEGQMLLSSTTSGGGPVTIGDFDNDGFPEIATAGGTYYGVYDLECKDAGPGCLGNYFRWSQPSQDASSSTTGSSIFDFEGDGRAEAVYADECYSRVYDGLSGEVLYSAYRTSCTWYENAIVADVDNDDRSEIVVNSNNNCNVSCPTVDPIHRGVPCETNEGCLSGVCDMGYCRCMSNEECPLDHVCAVPPNGTPGMGNTCRAENPLGVSRTGVRILRDTLDRWASSRPIWNQHAYSVTNVNDDATIPATDQWDVNHLQPELNNYRQTAQGSAGAESLPDITSELFNPGACDYNGQQTTMTAEVCNRGAKTVGAGLPVTFYEGDPMDGNILCTGFTSDVLPPGECTDVSCLADGEVTGQVSVVGNDDGEGGKTTLECIDTNNGHSITC